MKFGKISDLKGVNLELPPDHYLNKELNFSQDSSDLKIYVGGSVWGDKSYLGVVYPTKSKPAEYLKYYANQFNSIELNSTHYKIPSLELVEKWKSDVTTDFKFSPKFPQIISHRFNFLRRNDLTNEFLSSIYTFEEFLGMSFLQFPPGFSSKYMEELFAYLKFLPSDFELAIEFRHPSWFDDQTMLKIRDFLLNTNITLLITDVAGRRDVLHQVLTGKKVFVRFVGNNLHPSDHIRINDWLERLSYWVSLGINEVYFFIHQPTKGWASYTIKYMVDILNEKFNLNLKSPYLLREINQQQELNLK